LFVFSLIINPHPGGAALNCPGQHPKILKKRFLFALQGQVKRLMVIFIAVYWAMKSALRQAFLLRQAQEPGQELMQYDYISFVVY
jgi:hypothetical protein